jgi:formylmethanofuran dehydrogenase subunit E
MCKPVSARAQRLFRRVFPEAMRPSASVECYRCGETAVGDGPVILVLCAKCIDRVRDGMAQEDGVPICVSCLHDAAEETPTVFMAGVRPIDRESYPDGYTCEDCGESFVWRGGRARRIVR